MLRKIFSHTAFIWLRVFLLVCIASIARATYTRRRWMTPLLWSAWATVQGNPFLMAMFGGVIMASPAAAVHYVAYPLWTWISSYFVSRVVIKSMDRSYKKIRDFVMMLPHDGIGADSNLIVETKKQDWSFRDWQAEVSGTAIK